MTIEWVTARQNGLEILVKFGLKNSDATGQYKVDTKKFKDRIEIEAFISNIKLLEDREYTEFETIIMNYL